MYWFVFNEGNLLLQRTADGTYIIPQGETPPISPTNDDVIHHISPMDNGTEVRTFCTKESITPIDDYEWCALRASFHKLSLPLYLKAGKCEEILYWDKNTQFCGVCGAKMKLHTDISKKCTKCGKEVWPQLATAVITLIQRGDEVLLVQAKNFRGNYYGLVAGFVETGETLEEAVVREIREEVGIEVKNVRYYKSQPWPYPCGLIVGFFADYVSGEIILQESELAKGGWYHRNALPAIPEKLSLARQLIDAWKEGETIM